MSTSVWRALRQAGFLKAGTPFEMASTPVTAAPPEAKAWSTTNRVAPMSRPSPPAPNSTMPASWPTGSRPPVMASTTPTASSTAMLSMKK